MSAFAPAVISLQVFLCAWFVCAMPAFARLSLFLLYAEQSLAGNAPIVNVRLSPPASVPGIDEEVRNLDGARRSLESAGFEKLDASFRDAIRDAESRIGKAVAEFAPATSGAASPSSFVGVSASDAARSARFRLKVSPVKAPSRAIKQKVKLVEGVRAAQEDGLISQGVREMQLLVDIVVGELSSELSAFTRSRAASSGLGFLESRGAAGDLDVRFLSPETPFPRIADLVRAMEGRRAESENTVRQRIAELQLKLLQALNSMVGSALRSHLARS